MALMDRVRCHWRGPAPGLIRGLVLKQRVVPLEWGVALPLGGA